jgi:regulator of RNase E activity RraA
VPIEIDEVFVTPGDIVFADEDGIVFIPQEIEDEVIKKALSKVDAENVTRDAIKNGMKATAAYEKYGVL